MTGFVIFQLSSNMKVVLTFLAFCIISEATRVEGTISFSDYHRYKEIEEYLSIIDEITDSGASVETFGKTVEDRNLYVVKICSDGCGQKPIIFIDCGIHAREWLSPAMCLYVIQELVENKNNAYMLAEIDWYIVPVLNPDGYEYSHTNERMWRKTRSKGIICDGLDANRNFGFHWNLIGASNNECDMIYAGLNSFSVPETRALRDLILSNNDNMKLYLTIHSYGQYILHPWGYTYELPDDVTELYNLGKKAANAIATVRGTNYTVGSSANILYPAAGGSDDWVKAVGGVKFSYTIELPGGGDQGFDAPPTFIKPVVFETFEGIRAFHEYIAKEYGNI